MPSDNSSSEKLVQQVHDMAKFPEENPNPVMRVSGAGEILFANAAARALTGLLENEGGCLTPELGRAVDAASAAKRNREVEFASGQQWFVFAVTPVPGKSYVNLYGREVTEERKAQQKTRDVAKFPEENPNPVLRVSDKGEVLYANAAARKLTDLIDSDGSRLTHELGRTADAVYAGKQNREVEFVFGERWFSFALTAVPGETYVNLYGREITEERRARLDVLRIKNFNESILNSLTNGVLTLDASLRVTSANPAAHRILGSATNQVLGRAAVDLIGGIGGDLAQAAAGCSNGAEPIVWMDQELVDRSGLRKSVNVTLVPLRGQQGSSTHMLVVEDITRAKRIQSTMARFMSGNIVERLLETDEALLSGAAQDVSIVFSDIRNFTALSRRLGVRELVAVLNEYFSMMVDVIFEHSGTLDKFIGDALMAVFGAPFVTADDTDNAVRAATTMLQRLRGFNAEWAAKVRAPIDIGVGIDTGAVIAGTVGSPKRMDYTVIGEHVNLASRIESANKHYGTHILISEHTKSRLLRSCSLRELDLVQIPGIDTPVCLYEVLDYHTEGTFPNLERVLEVFAEGLAHYRNQQWSTAAKSFGHALTLNPHDRPTQIYLSRCWANLARPPGRNWTGITELSG
jgi:PAS domain S-box-containing protein